MEVKYKNYLEYVTQHLGFGVQDDKGKYPMLSVDLLDRTSSRQTSIYHSFTKNTEELQRAISICEAIIDSGKVKGDLRIYVAYNTVSISKNSLSEIIKKYTDYLCNDVTSRKILSVPKSVIIQGKQRKSFLLDVDTKNPDDVHRLNSLLDDYGVEVLLVHSTRKGFHYVVSATDTSAWSKQVASFVSVLKSDGYLFYGGGI